MYLGRSSILGIYGLNIPKIPQNEDQDFEIKIYSSNEFHSIEILFDFNYFINKENLFLLLKFYLTNDLNLIHSIAIIGKSDLKIPIFHHINENKLKGMQFIDFEFWLDDVITYDWQYLSYFSLYGFRIKLYNKFWSKTNLIPTFPWSVEFKNSFIRTRG